MKLVRRLGKHGVHELDSVSHSAQEHPTSPWRNPKIVGQPKEHGKSIDFFYVTVFRISPQMYIQNAWHR